jgi:hypothetical protein
MLCKHNVVGSIPSISTKQPRDSEAVKHESHKLESQVRFLVPQPNKVLSIRGKVIALSRRSHGFDSRWDRQNNMVKWPSGPRQVTANLYNRWFESNLHLQVGLV